MPYIEFEIEDEETGRFYPARINAKWEICDTCRGEGKHSSTSIRRKK